jgi:hypothetical protein
MHVQIGMTFNLDTGKRTSRLVVVYDAATDQVVDSPLAKQLLLPRQLPQEWLPAALRTGASGPVRSWTDRSLFDPDSDDGPEGLRG